MYAGGPEPGNHARVPVMRARRQSKGLPRRPSVPRANGPAVEASAPGRRGPQGAMTQPGSLPDAVAAGIDRAKGSAQRRASGSRKRPAICRPSATARQPASHQQSSATASQPARLATRKELAWLIGQQGQQPRPSRRSLVCEGGHQNGRICARPPAQPPQVSAARIERSDFLPGRRKRCSAIAGKIERA